ncbi:MAG: CarD family transcriptional regulator [Vulcanimicrobiota bacterium]
MNAIKYQIGDTIYHPQHGIGTVRDYDKKELLGAEHKFAILFFPREELQISLPAKKLNDTVREPLTESKARELLSEMSDIQESPNKSWKIRSRQNQERLASGDPIQLYLVYRGLLELRNQKGSLNNSDRRQLTQSLELLAEELAVALGKTDEQARVLLEKTTALDAA